MNSRRTKKRTVSGQTGFPESSDNSGVSGLIDVSFLLLAFFVATSTLVPAEAQLDLYSRPVDPAGQAVLLPSYEIQLTADGKVIANDEVLDVDASSRELPRLSMRLRDLKEAAELSRQEPNIILAAEDGASGQRFVDVLNALAEQEIRDITMAGFASGNR